MIELLGDVSTLKWCSEQALQNMATAKESRMIEILGDVLTLKWWVEQAFQNLFTALTTGVVVWIGLQIFLARARQGEHDGQILFGTNAFIKQENDRLTLKFVTLMEDRPLGDVFPNQAVVRAVQKAVGRSRRTQNPVLAWPNVQEHGWVMSVLINAISAQWGPGLAYSGSEKVSGIVRFVIVPVFESRDSDTKKIRVLILTPAFLEDVATTNFDWVDVDLERHKARFHTLQAIAEAYQRDPSAFSHVDLRLQG